MIKYNLILSDPPWSHSDKAHAGKRGAIYKYPCMTVPELVALKPMIDSLSDENCLLAMWWVGPMPQEAIDVVKGWGFKLKTMKGFTWHKKTIHGKDCFGGGSYTRCNSEDCLFATRGKRIRASASVPQILEAVRRDHSRKPDEIYLRLEKLLGDVPRIELFARSHRVGWSSWGLSINEDLNIIHSMDDHGDVTAHDISPQFKEKERKKKKQP